MPEMDEGSILYMPTTLPGLPSREAGWIVQQMDRKLKSFPEVERVFGKLGRADTATDPAPVEMIETTVMLKPRSQWRPGLTKDALIDEMNKAMTIVGYSNSWTQPISTRVMMQDTGIQTPVGLKVKGKDLAVVQQVAQNVEGLLRNLPGTASVIRRADLAGLLRGRASRSGADGARTASRWTRPCPRCASRSAATTWSASASPTRPWCRCRFSTRPNTSIRSPRSGTRRWLTEDGRAVPLGRGGRRGRPRSAGDDSQRQRRPGRLHLRLPARRDRPRVRGAGSRASPDEPAAAGRVFAGVDGDLSRTRKRRARRCASSCRSRWRSCSSC